MATINKRELLNLLDKKTLCKLADDYDLAVRANAGNKTLVDAIAAKRSIKLEYILPVISVNELKAACDYMGQSRIGHKQALAERLLPIQPKPTARKTSLKNKKATTAKQTVTKAEAISSTKNKNVKPRPGANKSRESKTTATSTQLPHYSETMNIAQIEENVKHLVTNLNAQNQESFIYDLLLAYGHRKQSITRLQSGERNLAKATGEIIWKRHLYFKQLSTENLHTEIDRMRKDKVVERNKLRFVIVTNFKQLLAVDTKTNDTLDIALAELPKQFDFFLPWAGMEKAVYKGENPADVKAAEKMAKLFDLIKADNFDNTNKDDKQALHNLNVFLTRLLFCFFAEDTGIFSLNQFSSSIKSHTNENGTDLDEYLNRLFKALNAPENKRKGLPNYLEKFPYVNGGLFADDIPSPKFSTKSRRMLIECGSELNWADINPDIFGSMFQAVVHPDDRGGMGMHYTSVSNIMKVIEPLFLNDLYDELEKVEDSPKKLQELQQRLGEIKIFDPACGSGNFLIIAYKELRRLEMEILKRIQEIEDKKSKQVFQLFSVVKLSQFYGIEIDDFAHEVAILSLWLAEHQMNLEFQDEFGYCVPSLPLSKSGNIVCNNATTINWECFCPIEGEVFILGNPPYLGSYLQSPEQKMELANICKGFKSYKDLDYICCWFLKAVRYMTGRPVKVAFVTTNSISQGEQVALLWPHIFSEKIEIGFAYQSFKWRNNAKSIAGVTCAIIGLRNITSEKKYIFNDNIVVKAENISPYLSEGHNIVVKKRSKPLSKIMPMVYGSKIVDEGNLILTTQEKDEFIKKYPEAKKFIRKFVGSVEFIRGTERWIFWIPDELLAEALENPEIKSRLNIVREFRLNSSEISTRKMADQPHRYYYSAHNDTCSIIVPRTSSERRKYIPIGFLDKEIIIADSAQMIPNADVTIFGIISSRMHMVWMRAVAGRLKSDYRYSSGCCYNTFPMPEINESQKKHISSAAVNILAVRELYPSATYAELYDLEKMPKDLKVAHENLDIIVDSCYRKLPFESDNDRLAFLFKLYEKMLGDQNA